MLVLPFSLLLGPGCKPGPANAEPVTRPGERHFIRPPKLELDIRREVIDDPETGRKNLRMIGTLTSQEQVMELRDMVLTVLVIGRHRANKDKPDSGGKWRMILHDRRRLDLKPGQIYAYESEIMESGEGDPWHTNYNIAYQGFIVRVENRYGEEALAKASDRVLLGLYPRLREQAAGADFLP